MCLFVLSKFLPNKVRRFGLAQGAGAGGLRSDALTNTCRVASHKKVLFQASECSSA